MKTTYRCDDCQSRPQFDGLAAVLAHHKTEHFRDPDDLDVTSVEIVAIRAKSEKLRCRKCYTWTWQDSRGVTRCKCP